MAAARVPYFRKSWLNQDMYMETMFEMQEGALLPQVHCHHTAIARSCLAARVLPRLHLLHHDAVLGRKALEPP